jgi:hypothetical protein
MGTYLLPKLQPMYNLWGSYDTLQRFDFFEAMRGVKFDFEKMVIGDEAEGKENTHGLDFDSIKRRVFELLQSSPKTTAFDFMNALGIKLKQWTIVKRFLPAWGIENKMYAGTRYYYLAKQDVCV